MARVRTTGRIAVLCLCLTLLGPGTLAAQDSDQKLSEIIGNLYIESTFGNYLALALARGYSDSDELRRSLLNQLGSVGAMNNLIGAQVSSFPLGSSAGGFSFTFDPTLGTFNRVSPSFGPVFSERALTIGRRRLNLGINYQRASFNSLEGKELRGGEIKFYTGLDFGLFEPFYIFFEDSLDLRLTTDTVGLFATYGVTDRLDVGIAVPIMNVRLRAGLATRIGTSAGGVDPEVIVEERVSDSANGIGDVVVRGKYNFWRARGGGLAAGIDWRLPTGDEEELLGIPGAQGKVYVAASTALGRFSPHFNVGLTVSGDTTAARSLETAVYDPPDEINYAGGVDVAVTDRLTVVGDLVGRTLRDNDRIDLRLSDVTLSDFGPNLREWQARAGSLSLLLGSVGVKFNPFGQGLVSVNLLFPLNDRGLRDDVTLVGGVEWSF